jgi:hypothetical protein
MDYHSRNISKLEEGLHKGTIKKDGFVKCCFGAQVTSQDLEFQLL